MAETMAETRRYTLRIEIEVSPQDDLAHFQPGTVVGRAPQLGAEWVSGNDAAALHDFLAFYLKHERLSGASAEGIPALAQAAYERAQRRQADGAITPERWAEIERVAAFGAPPDTLPSSSALARMVEDLADEVERSRAREAAALAIVRDVDDKGVYYTLQNGRRCYFCEAETDQFTGEPPHKPGCPVNAAHALLAE